MRQPGRRAAVAFRWSRALLGSLVVAAALYGVIRGRGMPAVAFDGAFAAAAIVGLRLRSWPVLGALAGAYAGGIAGASLGSSSLNAPLNGLLLAVCGAVAGSCLQMLERGPA